MSKNQFWLIKSYGNYLWKSRTRFHIHSPFVFDLVEKVFKNKSTNHELREIDNYKKNLSKSETIIETVDFGAGANHKAYSTSFQKVGNIVRKRSQKKKQAYLLHQLASYFQPENVLEFGTAAGFSTAYIKSAIPKSKMVSMEGCASLSNVASQTLNRLNIYNTNIRTGDFDVLLPEVLKEFNSLDMVFFDGNHREKPTLNYFNQCIELANENSLFIFDDIHWSPGMEKAWEEIKKDKRVSITIDLFWLGLVFFRKGIPKQDFIIRY